MKNKIVKGITLSLFSTLIVGFVAYRSGYLGGMKSSHSISPNGGALISKNDSIAKVDSLQRMTMMSSSKTIIIREQTDLEREKERIMIDSLLKGNMHLSSSKSMTIVKPEDMKRVSLDTTVVDSLKK